MGTPIHETYPIENLALRRRIAEEGLVFSQFAPNTSFRKFNFPMRNAVMSGYSLATVVISAEEKSGTRHQAQAAVGHGHPLILAKSVATGTTWGRSYVEKGLAIMADSPQNVVEHVEQILTRVDKAKKLVSWINSTVS